MTPAVTRARRTLFGALAAGAVCATLAIPAAIADPEDTPAPAPAATDCNAATLASTISTVTTQLSTYFAAHPDANQALIDATRQPAFIAVGQFEDYTDAHPDKDLDVVATTNRQTRFAPFKRPSPRSRTAAECRCRRLTRSRCSRTSKDRKPAWSHRAGW